MKGFIKLHRTVFDHYLWKEKRSFSRFEAWADTIRSARYLVEPEKVTNKGKLLIINRGEWWASQRFLAERWGWSNGKVQRFLKMLESDGMITRRMEHIETIIKVSKYDHYNPLTDAAWSSSDSVDGAPVDQQKVQTKERKEENNLNSSSSSSGLDNLDLRQKEFSREIQLLAGDLVVKTKFFNYWAEPDKNERMRFEHQDTWNTAMRFENWKIKEKDYGTVKQNSRSRTNAAKEEFLQRVAKL